MTHADIPLTPSIQSIVDVLTDALWRGRRALVATHGTPAEMRRSNARAFADLSGALATVRRLQRILRYMFIILAAWIELPKSRTAGALARPVAAGVAPLGDHTQHVAGEGAGGPKSTPRRMPVFTAVNRIFDAPAALPAAFVNAARDPVRLLARHIDALTHALLAPLPYIQRLARRLRRDACFIRWRPPKRNPPRARRAFWEELLQARDQAGWELHEKRWRACANTS